MLQPLHFVPKANPRFHIISSVIISLCLSKRERFLFKKYNQNITIIRTFFHVQISRCLISSSILFEGGTRQNLYLTVGYCQLKEA